MWGETPATDIMRLVRDGSAWSFSKASYGLGEFRKLVDEQQDRENFHFEDVDALGQSWIRVTYRETEAATCGLIG